MPDLKLVEAPPPREEPIIVLDTGPLGVISNPNATPENERGRALLEGWLARGAIVVVPHIVDHEVRRELLRARKSRGLKRLDDLRASLLFWPMSPAALDRAGELWAQARQAGRGAAPDLKLDADMILLAQAEEVARELDDETVIATGNVRHLAPFAHVRQWQDVR